MSAARLVLASASPRRSALLTQIGIPHEIVPARIEERRQQSEAIERCVLRLAEQKALEVLARSGTALPVLAADTAVVLDDEMLGKPTDRAAAVAMLSRLSGIAAHAVYCSRWLSPVPGRCAPRCRAAKCVSGR